MRAISFFENNNINHTKYDLTNITRTKKGWKLLMFKGGEKIECSTLDIKKDFFRSLEEIIKVRNNWAHYKVNNSTGYRYIALSINDNVVKLLLTYQKKITQFTLAKYSYQEALNKALKELKKQSGINIPKYINYGIGLKYLAENLSNKRYERIITKHQPLERRYFSNNSIPLLYTGPTRKNKLTVTMECEQDSTHLYTIDDKGGVDPLSEHFKCSNLSLKILPLEDIEKIKNDSRFVFCEISYHRLIGYWTVKDLETKRQQKQQQVCT